MAEFVVQKNYKAVAKAYKDKAITSIGLEGGSRSGKTYDVSIFILQYVNTFTGKQIVIGRDSKATLNTTIYKTVKEVFVKGGVPSSKFTKYASEMEINGNTIIWVGMNDGDQKTQGLESDVLWINEADLCDKEVFTQLEQRNKEFIILDYNPRQQQSWCYDRDKLPYHSMCYSTILDNKFAPIQAKRKILSYEPTEDNITMGTADAYLWNVYGLGERTAGEDAVFTKVFRYKDEPADYQWTLNGGDFGYSHDPTAIVRITRVGNKMYLRCLVYETGLLNSHIAKKMSDLGILKQNTVWDSANIKDIHSLRSLGAVANYADKGPGSKYWGIAKMQEFELHVADDPLSEILYQELIALRWLKDRNGDYKKNQMGQRITSEKESSIAINGNAYRIKDDAIDAARYGITYYLPNVKLE